MAMRVTCAGGGEEGQGTHARLSMFVIVCTQSQTRTRNDCEARIPTRAQWTVTCVMTAACGRQLALVVVPRVVRFALTARERAVNSLNP